MADVIVRGIDIPKSCFECVIHHSFFGDLNCSKLEGMSGFVGPLPHTNDRHSNCPILPLQEGHGDLIDRDNVLLDIDCIGTNRFGMLDEDIRAFLRRYEPIVPAEGGTDDERVM